MAPRSARRPTFDLGAQLKAHESRGAGTSKMDGWFAGLCDFMKGAGSMPGRAGSKRSYIVDDYMKTRRPSDPSCAAFADRDK